MTPTLAIVPFNGKPVGYSSAALVVVRAHQVVNATLADDLEVAHGESSIHVKVDSLLVEGGHSLEWVHLIEDLGAFVVRNFVFL